ncbi:DNA sulfur modification protein DndE [Pectobacterium odoriferum]|uniref:DNA sulfur modification protein DndE n=1 Tax=Pectobacterium odoriferum TaxID=78398 RepID=UPI0032EE2FAF
MLPNRLQLNSRVEEQLRRLKNTTGISPNISARVAFFRSVESGYRFHGHDYKTDGKMSMDKVVWLGDTIVATELILKMLYPKFDSRKYAQAWAAHVEDGSASLRNHRELITFLNEL